MKFSNVIEGGRLAGAGLKDFARSIANPTLRLGVTGLSGAGKTVFITALVHALLRGGRLPAFEALSAGRIGRVYLEPQPAGDLPRFAYEEHLAALTGPDRHWPQSTRHISQLRLTIEYTPHGFLARRLGWGRLHVDIVDYPGEWLLDLPMIQMSYAEWSAATLASGRPGNAPPLPFEALNGPESAEMALRYSAHVEKVVKPFFYDHFARLDRQIVLVDVLNPLNEGASAVTALQATLTQILSCFRQGSNSLFTGLFGHRIERILFAATKADLLHHTSHDRLEAILSAITAAAAKRAEYSGANVSVAAIAAIRATREATVQGLDCVVGQPENHQMIGETIFDGETEAAIFPGDLPRDAAHAFDGSLAGHLEFVGFRPPLKKHGSLPHIRLDRVLEFLIGDRLA